jgi:Alkaline and neutral invertase
VSDIASEYHQVEYNTPGDGSFQEPVEPDACRQAEHLRTEFAGVCYSVRAEVGGGNPTPILAPAPVKFGIDSCQTIPGILFVKPRLLLSPSPAPYTPVMTSANPRSLHKQEFAIVEQARSLFLQKTLVTYAGQHVGAVAAISPSRSAETDETTFHDDLNYGEVFIRDNVPVMLYLLLEGKTEAVRHFLDTCLQLQSTHPQTLGIFPASFGEQHGELVADYGQRAIGRVCSVDATLWFPILAHAYVQKTGDRDWASELHVQLGLQRLLHLILQPKFRNAPTLYVPDGAFMIDRPMDVWGAPLEIQVLLQGCLLSAAGLIHISLERKGCCTTIGDQTGRISLNPAPDPFTEEQIRQFVNTISSAKRLRRYLLKHYWVNQKTVQVLRRRPTEQYGDIIMNEYNIQTEVVPHWLQDWLGESGGYLLGNIRTGRPDFRFFTLGNCLGAVFDVLSNNQQQDLFQLIWRNREDLISQMPLRICHPPLDDLDWRNKTGFDPKNRPWCYHNAGHWPCLLWFLVIAILRHQQQQPEQESNFREDCHSLLYTSYQLLLRRLPQQKWAEYFDGPTGLWTGQQARYYQTWTIVGFLLTHHFLKVNPLDARILDVPKLRDLRQIRLVGM